MLISQQQMARCVETLHNGNFVTRVHYLDMCTRGPPTRKSGDVRGCTKIWRLIRLLLLLLSSAAVQVITVGTHRVQAPIWHKDVRFFQVSQNGQPKAYFYLGEFF